MEKITYSVTLQSDDSDEQNRINDVVTQFNEWITDKNPSSMLLNFTTSEQHPLRMEEIANFFEGSPYFDAQHDKEWMHCYDDTLNEDVRVEVLDRKELKPFQNT